jgi:integrase
MNETTSLTMIVDGESGIASYDPEGLASYWLEYFDPQRAVDEMLAHVAGLPGQRDGRESHTERAYRDGLAYVLERLGCNVDRELKLPVGEWFRMPGRGAVKSLIAHLFHERGLSSSTVNSKYLTPLRHFLRALVGQTPMPRNAHEYMLIGMIKDELREAATVKGPGKEETSNLAPLWREGTRLETHQVNQVLRDIDTETLDGKRDYALLSVAFYTGLRRAELAAITPNSIRREGGKWLLQVVGKRNNTDPVTLPDAAYERLMMWVEAFNEALDPDDPRRIEGDRSVWQPLRRGGHRVEADAWWYRPARGMTDGSLGDVIKRRVEGVLDVTFSAHDARRTLAATLHKAGALVNVIQKILRHKDAAVTLGYIGEPPDYAATDASLHVRFG